MGLVSAKDAGNVSGILQVIAFGGNAHTESGALMQAQLMLVRLAAAHELMFEVYSLSYRGYTLNEGWASQATQVADGKDLFQHVSHVHGHKRLILIGTSMG